MKNIVSVNIAKYQDIKRYQNVENGIFKDLKNKRYVITLRFELEENDNSQYPLEDILDRYLVNCTDHIVENEENGVNMLEVEIEDGNDKNYTSLNDIKQIASLVGKRVYNKEVDGRIELLIE